MKLKWSADAEKAVARIPFFIRKKVKKRVEDEALRAGARKVSVEHVQECKRRYLHRMEEEVKGFQVETCFGPSGCPNRAIKDDDLAEKLEDKFLQKDWRAFLKNSVKSPLKMHHEFRISISDCPNACSRPQIADMGVIGLRSPKLTQEACCDCGDCIESCQEEAISMPSLPDTPILDFGKCLSCGKCIEACPTGTISEENSGYRILTGGKLGRHPQLGRPLAGIFSREDVLKWADHCMDFYQKFSQKGERFGTLLNRHGWENLSDQWQEMPEKSE